MERIMEIPAVETIENAIGWNAQTASTQALSRLFKLRAPPLLRAGAPTAAAYPPPDGIMDIINTAAKAPAGTSIAAVPTPLSAGDLQNLQDIVLLDTYVSVYSAGYLYQLNPKGFDITSPDGAASFTRDLANARFRVFTQGLAGVLSL